MDIFAARLNRDVSLHNHRVIQQCLGDDPFGSQPAYGPASHGHLWQHLRDESSFVFVQSGLVPRVFADNKAMMSHMLDSLRLFLEGMFPSILFVYIYRSVYIIYR